MDTFCAIVKNVDNKKLQWNLHEKSYTTEK